MNNSQIVDALEQSIGIDGRTRDLTDAIANELVAGGLHPIEAAERAGQRKAAVASVIVRRKEVAEATGTVHLLEIVGMFDSEVGGAGRPNPSDDETVQLAKLGRRQVAAILERMRSLTPDEFEQFGAALVKSFGATISEKTRQTGDQGIDFVGTARIGDLLDKPRSIMKLVHEMQIDFIGQAKHYPKRTIQPSIVRELVGSLELARSRHFSSEKFALLEDLSLRSFSPVFALLITTGRLSAGAKTVAEKAGIIARSGDQLATYLADLGVGIDPESGEFSEDLFVSWISD